jgi:ferric iron reductase protein FhuF
MRATRAETAELRPIVDVLDRVRARLGEPPVHGLAPGLVAADGQGDGWIPATALADGSAVGRLLDAAARRWRGDPHVTAALAWKSYAYWITLPIVIGYAAGRVVPDVRPDNVEFQIHGAPPFVALRLIRPDVTTLMGDDALLTELRKGLLDEHLDPMLEQFRTRVNIGRRTLAGSIASAVGYAVARAQPDLPPRARTDAGRILEALGVSNLVDLVTGPDGKVQVQRRTCCLAFALEEPKICSGCVIPAAAATPA